MPWTRPAIAGRNSLHKDAKRALKNARSTIARYKGSSQAQASLKDNCEGVKIKRMAYSSIRSNKGVVHFYIGQAADLLDTFYYQAGYDARAQNFSTDGRSRLGDWAILLKICTVYRVDILSEATKVSRGR